MPGQDKNHHQEPNGFVILPKWQVKMAVTNLLTAKMATLVELLPKWQYKRE
jgi:hypothetical protein